MNGKVGLELREVKLFLQESAPETEEVSCNVPQLRTYSISRLFIVTRIV